MVSGKFTGVRLVARDSSIVAAICEGFADVDAQRPWTLQTRSQVASISKQFAAALTLLMVGHGTVTLDASVATVLPECPGQWRDVSLRQLLTHTSGMAHWGDLPGLDPAQPLESAHRLTMLLAAPLANPPGQTWCYSSPGYIVLAAVLARAAQQPYSELVEDCIIDRLALSATTVGEPVGSDTALGYRHGQPVTPWQLHTMPGTGDICSSAPDLAVFLTALHSGTLLPPHIQPLLHSVAVPLPKLPAPHPGGQPARIASTHYCAGHFHGTVDGQFAYLHPGDNPGYQSLAAWLPATGTVYVTLSNTEDLDLDEVVADVNRQAAG